MTIDWQIMMLYDDDRLTSDSAICAITIDWEVMMLYDHDRFTSDIAIWSR